MSWTTLYWFTDNTFGVMYADWLILMAFDDRHCMLPLNDVSRDLKMDLSSPGVVTLDTTIVPDVFGLHAFDHRAPAVRVLPGKFSNTVRVLVLDVNVAPVGFHDVLVANLSNTPVYHVKPVSARDLTLLKQCWPSSLFAMMNKRQVDMESLCRECKSEFDREFGGGQV